MGGDTDREKEKSGIMVLEFNEVSVVREAFSGANRTPSSRICLSTDSTVLSHIMAWNGTETYEVL